MRRLCSWIGMALLACATPKAPAASASTPVADPPTVTQLEGYRSSLHPEQVFGGLARLLEVGPTNAPIVLLVHGIGESGAADFFPILPQLAKRNRVYAIDLPGFGQSTRSTALYSPEQYVRFLHEYVRPRISGNFTLIGHSMGGAISLLYAHRHPDDVTRLVLIDAAGILHREALVPFITHTGVGSLFEPVGGIAGTLSSILVSRAAGPEALLENDLARSQLLGDSKRIAAAALIVHDFGPSIAELRTPTLVVWGRADPIAPLRTGTLLGSRLPGAQLRILEHSAHVPMQTEPDTLAAAILRWLAEPIRTPGAEVTPSAQVGRCDHTNGVRFEGSYRELEIVGCQNVQLSRVQAQAVRIWHSRVVIEGAQLHGSDAALYAAHSLVEITGCVLSAMTALRLDSSELDVAGSDLIGTTSAVHTSGPSRILFSASRIRSGHAARHLHEVVELARDRGI